MTETRHTAHAAQGRARLRQTHVERPDTVIHLPGGETMTLRRSEKDASMPMFRKLDPKKFDIKSGRLHALKNKGGKGDGKGAAKKGPFSLPSALPFSQIVVTVLLAQQLFSFLNSTVGRWWRGRRSGGSAEQGAARGNAAAAEVWEEDLDEEERLKLAAARKAQAEMTRAMLRNALPKPQRQSLPERAAAAHSSRQRPVPSAKQRMQPPTGVQQRKKGKLERMDDIVKKEVKAALAAARTQQRLMLGQGAGAAQQGPTLPGPGPSAAAAPRVAPSPAAQS